MRIYCRRGQRAIAAYERVRRTLHLDFAIAERRAIVRHDRPMNQKATVARSGDQTGGQQKRKPTQTAPNYKLDDGIVV